jgi:hypothetical protein
VLYYLNTILPITILYKIVIIKNIISFNYIIWLYKHKLENQCWSSCDQPKPTSSCTYICTMYLNLVLFVCVCIHTVCTCMYTQLKFIILLS